MHWESLGFSEFPFEPKPIETETLGLFTGYEEQQKECKSVLDSVNRTIVVEGGRGVGTTSFGNFLRFNLHKQKKYFTPSSEIRIEPQWRLETVLGVIISNIVREMELHISNIEKKKIFKDAKALSNRLHQSYRSFGVSALGFGASYGRSGQTSQPIIVPSQVLGHHLEDLVGLAKSIGYKNGIILQLNNLDVGTVHEESDLKYLLNALRDYLHSLGASWLLIGDQNLRGFIARAVDRVDDVISYEVTINPLNQEEFRKLVEKRIAYFRRNDKAKFPVDMEVFDYLFMITRGRLRYVFGLLLRMLTKLRVGDLTDRVTLDFAKPIIRELALERMKRSEITATESKVLEHIAKNPGIGVTELAKAVKKPLNYVSNVANKLLDAHMVSVTRDGRKRLYFPSVDAEIAYLNLA